MKILIITPEGTGGNSSSAYLLRNLFSTYDKSSLAFLVHKSSHTQTYSACHTWKLSNFGFNFKKIEHSKMVSIKPNRFLDFLKSFSALKSLLNILLKISPLPTVPDHFLKWCKHEYRPDIIYTWLGSRQSASIVLQLKEQLNIPVAVHFMDDWLSGYSSFANINIFGIYQLKKMVDKILDDQTSLFVISHSMSVEYQKRFNKTAHVINTCVSNELLKILSKKDTKRSQDYQDVGVLRLTYIGRLLYGRDKVLQYLLNTVESNPYLANKIKISVYSQDRDLLKTNKDIDLLSIYSAPEDKDLPGIQRSTDFLLHIDGFAKEHITYFMHSSTGKFSLYLALARPLLCISPPELNTFNEFKRLNAGFYIDHLDPQRVNDTLMQCLNLSNQESSAIGLRMQAEAELLQCSAMQSRFISKIKAMISENLELTRQQPSPVKPGDGC